MKFIKLLAALLGVGSLTVLSITWFKAEFNNQGEINFIKSAHGECAYGGIDRKSDG